MRGDKGAFLGVDRRRLIEAGECLQRFCEIMDENEQRMPPESIQECLDTWKRHAVLTEGLDDLMIPKRHVILHMILRMPIWGNPRYYANWRDEHLNKILKRACREISQLTFRANTSRVEECVCV